MYMYTNLGSICSRIGGGGRADAPATPTVLALLLLFLKSAHAHSCTSGVPSLHTGVGTGTCVSGRIESGHAQVGEGVLLLPANELATIKCM